MERPERIPGEQEDRFDCIRCSASFLSEEALERHYDWNPEHAEPVTLDARELEEEGTKLEDSAWIEFGDRIETFLTVAEDVDENALEMTYRPEEGSVLVDGPREQTIDVSEAQELASSGCGGRSTARTTNSLSSKRSERLRRTGCVNSHSSEPPIDRSRLPSRVVPSNAHRVIGVPSAFGPSCGPYGPPSSSTRRFVR